MAKIKILSARSINALQDGFHADGGNLFLRVRSDSRSYVFRYKKGKNGKHISIALGTTHTRSLMQAREIAARMRTAVKDNKDPADELMGAVNANARTFKDYAEELIENNKKVWKSVKHHQQWLNTLSQYVYSTIGSKIPSEITLADIKDILTPLWMTKTETASRVRMRIESVLDYAAVLENSDRKNPARWRGNLDKLFPAPRKISKPVHFASAPYQDVPSIMAELRNKTSLSAYCLRFTILTASRSGEARGCRFSEISIKEKIWVIDKNRMKAGVEHRIPLNDEAIEILTKMQELRQDNAALVFQGERGGVISDIAINKTLHAIAPNCTVHGFRSSFRVWTAEATPTPRAVAEAALSHVNKDRVEAAYQRSDLFDLRRKLMKAWGLHCASKSNVVSINSKEKIG